MKTELRSKNRRHPSNNNRVRGVSGSRRASPRRWPKPLGAAWASPFPRSLSPNKAVLSGKEGFKGTSTHSRNPTFGFYYAPSSLRVPAIPTLVLQGAKEGRVEGGGCCRTSCVWLPRVRSATFPYEMSFRLVARSSLRLAHPRHSRSLFGLFKRKEQRFAEPNPLLSEDNLLHPFSKSPFPAIRERGEAIKQLAPCPVCSSQHEHVHAHTNAQPKAVNFECPDCGWPTHCSEEHWVTDKEHQKYCSRLREVNEDEHDLRSGRKLHEFDLPGITFSTPLFEIPIP